ncbi:MAG: hypothetical protein ACI8QT_000712 [Halioglobus sp.]
MGFNSASDSKHPAGFYFGAFDAPERGTIGLVLKRIENVASLAQLRAVKKVCISPKPYYCIYIQLIDFQAHSMNDIPHAIGSESNRFTHTARLDLRVISPLDN